MGQDDAIEGDRAETFGALEVAFLGGRQQRVQHLDGGLEHFHEFQQALVGEAQAARVAVGVGIVLRILFQLADVDLADQGGNVLVVFIARLGLGNADLAQDGRIALDHAELADVAVVLVQALDGPGAQDGFEIAARDAVLLFEDGAVFVVIEQAQRGFIDRRTLDGIEGHLLHELLQALGNGGLAATDRAQQIKDLLLLFQALRGMAEIRNHLLDHFFRAVELLEGGIDLDDLVGEDAREARIFPGVDLLRFADGHQHPFGSRCIDCRVVLAKIQILFKR